MTSVLLISDTEKVQRLFASLEKKGLFQLRTAATLTQGDQEISGSAPDVTFVQSRISGFSGLIVLRHLNRALPKQAKVVLLAADTDDAEQARQGAVPFLDLTLEDEALAEQVRQVVEGAGRPARKKAAAPKQVDLGKIVSKGKQGAPSPPDAAQASAAAGKTKREKPGVPQAPPALPVAGLKEPVKAPAKKAAKEPTKEPGKQPAKGQAQALKEARQAVKVPAQAVKVPAQAVKVPAQAVKVPAQAKEPMPEPVPEPVKEPVKEPLAMERGGAPAVQAKMHAAEPAATAEVPGSEPKEPAAQSKAPEAPVPEPEEPRLKERPHPAAAKAAASSFEEVMRRASAKTTGASPAPPEVADRVDFGKPAAEHPPAPERQVSPDREEVSEAAPEEFYQGEPLEQAMLRAQKKKLPGWIIPLAVALVFIPLAVFYLVGRKPSPQPPQSATAPAMAPGPTTAKGAALSPLTAAQPGAVPSAQPGPEPAAQPVQKTGLKALPPIVQGLKLDPEYGKTEPGWTRYIGATAEYKLFREEDLYRAIQVIALAGATIPDQIFKRVLLEFGGGESYRVESTGKKGDYLLEHGSVNGQVGLTIYRRKEDLQMKGFVVYYR